MYNPNLEYEFDWTKLIFAILYPELETGTHDILLLFFLKNIASKTPHQIIISINSHVCSRKQQSIPIYEVKYCWCIPKEHNGIYFKKNIQIADRYWNVFPEMVSLCLHQLIPSFNSMLGHGQTYRQAKAICSFVESNRNTPLANAFTNLFIFVDAHIVSMQWAILVIWVLSKWPNTHRAAASSAQHFL